MVLLADTDRPGAGTAQAGDLRSVPLQLWYPAEADTGTPAAYVWTGRHFRRLQSSGALFDRWLVESRDRPYDGLVAPADIYMNLYPLGELEPIPAQ